jgi:DNA-binding XRE family transcriptional regulator
MTEKYGYRELLIESLGGRCKKCKSTEDLEIDHVKPRLKDGEHKLSNIQLLCRKHHWEKTTEDLKEKSTASNHKKDTSFLHIPNNLRARRIELKLRQEDVGSAIGMARGTYSILESGNFLPNLRVLDMLTDFFKCEPLDLYESKILHIINLESSDD